uniref:BZIP domain-containing protein n=1 Tax=Panagrellus redivivus TaxID=6233 RepID=A0A7E4W6I8_PANRE
MEDKELVDRPSTLSDPVVTQPGRHPMLKVKLPDEPPNFPQIESHSDPTHNRLPPSRSISPYTSQTNPEYSSLSQYSRRRGRPRKEGTDNDDMKTVAKRMYARAYRESMKERYSIIEQQRDDLEKELEAARIENQKLNAIVKQCHYCSKVLPIVNKLNVDPKVLKSVYKLLLQQ